MSAENSTSRAPYSAANLLSFVTNNTILILVVALFALAGFFLGSVWTENRMLKKGVTAGTQPEVTAPAVPAATAITQEMVSGLFDEGVITFGKKDSQVTFVEFSDPSCPYCHIAAGKNPDLNNSAGTQFKLKADGGSYEPPVPEMKKLVDAGKAAFVWVYSPGHGNGELASKALYCAHEKGKFWPVHDLLMSSKGYDLLNNTVKNDKAQATTLAAFTKSAMSESDMTKCLSSGKYDEVISRDTGIATKFGVSGTPGFIVNTQLFPGANSFVDMKSVVDAALNS